MVGSTRDVWDLKSSTRPPLLHFHALPAMQPGPTCYPAAKLPTVRMHHWVYDSYIGSWVIVMDAAERNTLCTCTSQMAVVASKLAVARYRPSGDQLVHLMLRWCVSSRMAVHTQVSVEPCCCQILTVLSPLQLAMLLPVGQLHTYHAC